ncbi:MAG: nicotinamide riboside transporter PnuC [Bacteroidia bacterium]
MSNIEFIAALIAFFGVLLTARASILGWPFGIVGAILYSYIFIISGLYAESVLQALYVVFGFFGWYNWLSMGKTPENRPVILLDTKTAILSVMIWFSGGFLIGYLLKNFSSGNSPYVDANLAVGGLVATYLMAKKSLQNWLFWIIIDLASAALFFTRELYATSFLYLTFTVLAVQGYILWKRELKEAS